MEERAKLQKSEAKNILLSIWDKLQSEEFDSDTTTSEILASVNISQEIYEKAMQLMSSKQSVVLKRNPNELWINHYNPFLLECWNANMDIQFVLDPFSCIVYVVSYISKAEREMGILLKQTKIEAAEGNMDAKQTMRKIGSAYLHHREVSAQEAVYRICNLRMRECSRKVIFIPIGENPTRLSKPISVLTANKKHHLPDVIDENLDTEEDEDDIWMISIVDIYQQRPDCQPFPSMCLGTFCSQYRVLSKSQIPKEQQNGVYELKNGKGFIKVRSKSDPAIIRYPRFSSEKKPRKTLSIPVAVISAIQKYVSIEATNI